MGSALTHHCSHVSLKEAAGVSRQFVFRRGLNRPENVHRKFLTRQTLAPALQKEQAVCRRKTGSGESAGINKENFVVTLKLYYGVHRVTRMKKHRKIWQHTAEYSNI